MALSSDDEWGAFKGGGDDGARGTSVVPAVQPAGDGGADADNEDDEFGDFEGGGGADGGSSPHVPPPLPPLNLEAVGAPAAASTLEDDSFGDFEGADIVSRLAGVHVDDDRGGTVDTPTDAPAAPTPTPWTPPAGWTEAPAAIAVADLVPPGQALPEDLFAEAAVVEEEVVVEENDEAGVASAGDDDAAPAVDDDAGSTEAAAATDDAAVVLPPSPPSPAPASDDEWDEFEGGAAAQPEAAPPAEKASPPLPASPSPRPRTPSPPPAVIPSPASIHYPAERGEEWAALVNAACVELEASTGAWRAVCAAAAQRGADAATHPNVARWLQGVAHVLAVVRVVQAAAAGTASMWEGSQHAGALRAALARAEAAADPNLMAAADAAAPVNVWREHAPGDDAVTCGLTGVRAAPEQVTSD